MARENEHQASGRPSVEERRQQRHQMRHDSHALTTWHVFIRDLSELGGFDRAFAERAAACVLQILEERLYGTEARNLEAQLPSVLRRQLEKGERHEGSPPRKFGLAEVLKRVGGELGIAEVQVEPVVRAVLAAVRSHVTEGEAEDVAAQLPADLATLWRMPS